MCSCTCGVGGSGHRLFLHGHRLYAVTSIYLSIYPYTWRKTYNCWHAWSVKPNKTAGYSDAANCWSRTEAFESKGFIILSKQPNTIQWVDWWHFQVISEKNCILPVKPDVEQWEWNRGEPHVPNWVLYVAYVGNMSLCLSCWRTGTLHRSRRSRTAPDLLRMSNSPSSTIQRLGVGGVQIFLRKKSGELKSISGGEWVPLRDLTSTC